MFRDSGFKAHDAVSIRGVRKAMSCRTFAKLLLKLEKEFRDHYSVSACRNKKTQYSGVIDWCILEFPFVWYDRHGFHLSCSVSFS